MDAVNRDAERHAAELAAQAQRLTIAASRASAATRDSSNSDGGRTAAALQAASRAASQAAQHLHQAAVTGKGFVTRHSAGVSYASPKAGDPGTTIAHSLRALVARLAGTPYLTLASLPALDSAVAGALSSASASLALWGVEDRRLCEKWFGTSSDFMRQHLISVVQRMQQHAGEVKLVPFEHNTDEQETFAYVYPSDPQRRVFVGDLFWSAGRTPPDTQAGVILHELSHFLDIAGTGDHAKGPEECEELSMSNPALAVENADNIEYYFEELVNR